MPRTPTASACGGCLRPLLYRPRRRPRQAGPSLPGRGHGPQVSEPGRPRRRPRQERRPIDGLPPLASDSSKSAPSRRAAARQPRAAPVPHPEKQAIINRMGFNNEGVDQLIANVKAAKFRRRAGSSASTSARTSTRRSRRPPTITWPASTRSMRWPATSPSTSRRPNTKNLRELQKDEALDALLAPLKAAQQRLSDTHGRYVPMALKIAPDLDDARSPPSPTAAPAPHGRRDRHQHHDLARRCRGPAQCCGNGRPLRCPLFDASTEVVRKLAAALQGELPIIGVGGIMSGAAAGRCEDRGGRQPRAVLFRFHLPGPGDLVLKLPVRSADRTGKP